MITSLYYFFSKIFLFGLFSAACLVALTGIGNPDADFMPFFVMLLFAVAGILTITLIPHLTIKKWRVTVLFLLTIVGFSVMWELQEYSVRVFEVFNFSDNSELLIANILTCFTYFLPTLIIVFVHWHLRWVKGKRIGKKKTPELLIAAFQTILFALTALIVLTRVFAQDLTAIFATSGVLALIVGLAIQPNLRNIFSGIFVSLERPFQPNEWVTIDDKTGIVLDVTWRSTKIRTFENVEVTIPNETVAKSTLQNWSRPDQDLMSEGFHIFNTISFHPRHDPRYISELITNALCNVTPVDGRQTLGLKWVKFIEVDEYGLKFAVAFDCTNRLLKNSQQNVVLTEIHQVLAQAGISMSVGRLTTFFDEDTSLSALAADVAQKNGNPEKIFRSGKPESGDIP